MGVREAMRFASNRMSQALQRFQQSARLDPGFARAFAGQSFCHYPGAFINDGPDRRTLVEAALRAAKDTMNLDGTNPAVLWA